MSDVVTNHIKERDREHAQSEKLEKLKVAAKLYLLALELYLPSAIGVVGQDARAGALRAAEKDLRHILYMED